MKPPMIQENSRTPQAEETAERWATKKKIVARGSLALIAAALLVLGLNKWIASLASDFGWYRCRFAGAAGLCRHETQRLELSEMRPD